MSRPKRRWITGIVVGFIVIAVAAVGAFAALSDDVISAATDNASLPADDVCREGGDARLAATTTLGAQVFVGKSGQPGEYCLIYRDAQGTTVRSGGALGASPVGRSIVLKALDTSVNKYVLVIAVPDGFSTASVGTATSEIQNNVLVIDADEAPDVVEISGPAGRETLKLHELKR